MDAVSLAVSDGKNGGLWCGDFSGGGEEEDDDAGVSLKCLL